MSLRVIAPGPLATVQDAGRYGYRPFGVPVSGPFDRRSAVVANSLLGNDPGLAVIELTAFGGTYEAEADLAIALAGAPMPARIEGVDGSRTDRFVSFAAMLHRGDRLVVGSATVGHRAYLAVRGGWNVPELLGSRCSEKPLKAGDRLAAESHRTHKLRTDLGRVFDDLGPIRFVDGPDAGLVRGWLEGLELRVGRDSDRMGVRLEGPPVAISTPADRLSAPVAPGTIQLAGGLPMVLGPACGTMGGYPNIGHVLSADLDRLGQKHTGMPLWFRGVSLEEAREVDRLYRAELAALSCRLRTVANHDITPR